ncbi:ABC transporter permease [Desnuesiella massiliensis]|uniref:ABC transporter permease n=1 Tax=Desnuesiella massiliensis TaxID=1650662 RepID=UPI001FA6F0CD|nr:ABC transporter permease [Desnuesiella massiliensis]
MTLTEKLENCLSLIKINIKISILWNLIFSIGFLCLLPFIQGVANLDRVSAAICLENFVAIIGVILLVPVFSPEESKEIDEIISSKFMPNFKPYIARIALSAASILILIASFCLMLKYNSCEFYVAAYIFGTFASALFLGSIGMLISSLSASTIVGYMASIGYLIINMMTGSKYVGKFYIMSMKNNSFDEKYYILIGSIVLIMLSIFIKGIKRKI